MRQSLSLHGMISVCFTIYYKQLNLKVMSKYQCGACPYIYDTAIGDPDNNIPAETSFADLPDDWACPLCGETKDGFTEIVE